MPARKTKSQNKPSAGKRSNQKSGKSRVVPATTGSTARDFLASNSVPIALVAAGMGMLAAKNINGGDNAVSRVAVNGKAKVADIAAAAGKKGKSAARKAQRNSSTLTQNAGAGFAKAQETVRRNPVATGLTAFALGAGLAIALPKLTERRNNT